MDELTKKWDGFGLLVGLTDVEKTMLALNFERTALHIIGHTNVPPFHSENQMYDKVNVLIFPVLRRISVSYTNENGLDVYQYYHINPIELLDHFTNFMNSRESQDLISDLQTYAQIDWEVEICQLYSEHFSYKFRSTLSEIKPIKYLLKHRL